MRTNRKIVLLGFCAVLAGVCLVVVFLRIHHQGPGAAQMDSASADGRVAKSREVERGGQDRSSRPSVQTAMPVIAEVSVDLDSVLRAALAEKDPSRRKELLKQWALMVPIDGMKKLMEWSKTISDPQVQSEIRLALVTHWAAEDPLSVVGLLSAYAAPTPDNPNGSPEWSALLGKVSAQWAAADANHAVLWAQSLPEGPVKTVALAQVGCQLRHDVGNWAESDPSAGAAWVNGLPEGDAKVGVIACLATIWAHQDPVAAANFVSTLPAGTAQNQAVAAVVTTWALTDPKQAAQWVGQIPESAARDQALQGLIGIWGGQDANGVAQWLQSLPQTPSRDVAISAFSGTVADRFPAIAFQWAETISDATLRSQQLENVAGIWLKQDPTAAQQNIVQSNLPQDIKSRLLK